MCTGEGLYKELQFCLVTENYFRFSTEFADYSFADVIARVEGGLTGPCSFIFISVNTKEEDGPFFASYRKQLNELICYRFLPPSGTIQRAFFVALESVSSHGWSFAL